MDAVTVGVGIQWIAQHAIDASDDFFAVGDTVIVGVGVEGIGSIEPNLVEIGDSVAVAIEPNRDADDRRDERQRERIRADGRGVVDGPGRGRDNLRREGDIDAGATGNQVDGPGDDRRRLLLVSIIAMALGSESARAQGSRCDFVEVAAGTRHTLGLKSDGTVWAWGDNEWGQLGDASVTARSLPVQVLGPGGTGLLSDVVTVAAGGWHSLALTIDGKVYAWGSNAFGQLGRNPSNPALGERLMSVPVSVIDLATSQPLAGVTAIAAGSHHGLALKSNGTVVAWGWNDAGQLGNGLTVTSEAAVLVSGLTQVRVIAAGHAHSLALRADGMVWAWGYNSNGQLGQNPTTTAAASTPMFNSFLFSQGLARSIAAGAGSNHSLALMTDGTVTAWGWNESGQLGRGSSLADDYQAERVVIAGFIDLAEVKSIAAGSRHSVALRADGTVWAWGWNAFGQLGYATSPNYHSPIAATVADAFLPYTATAIAAGGMHSVSAQLGGSVRAWGDGNRGQLGSGTFKPLPAPPPAPPDIAVVDATVPCTDTCISRIGPVAGGKFHSATLSATGQGLAWGRNDLGQIGNGQSGPGADCAVPMNSINDTLMLLNPRQLRVAVAAGANHVLALTSDGKVWAWGDNECGQLGNGVAGSGMFSPTAAVVKDAAGTGELSGIIAIAAGRKHSLALRADGAVWAWGDNGDEQLGNTTVMGVSALPVLVMGPPTLVAVAIAGGWAHSLAVSADGTVWGFGSNTQSQLANPPGSSPVARLLQDLSSSPIQFAVAVAAGQSHSLALLSNGVALSWGANGRGQLGRAGPDPDPEPVPVDFASPGLTTARAITTSAGADHSLLVASGGNDAGTAWAWGAGTEGQLGIGALSDSGVPVPVMTLAGPLGGARHIGAGTSHSLASRIEGHGFTWGRDDYGQLGDGSPFAPLQSTLASPILMDLPPPEPVGNILFAVKIGSFPHTDLQLQFSGAPRNPVTGSPWLRGIFRDPNDKTQISTLLLAKLYPATTSYDDAGAVLESPPSPANLFFYQVRGISTVCEYAPGIP